MNHREEYGMKMKEVQALTGLTEKTIRFYTQKGLVCPQSELRGDRTWLEYSQKDVETLQQIATLRKAGFSLDDIAKLQSTPNQIVPVIRNYIHQAQSQVRQQIDVADRLAEYGPERIPSLATLTTLIQQKTEPLPLPVSDCEPNFGRLDEEPPPAASDALTRIQKKEELHYRLAKYFIYFLAGANVLGSLFSLIVSGTFLAFILDVLLSALLVAGFTFSRVLFIISSALTFLSLLFTFLAALFSASATPPELFASPFILIYNLIRGLSWIPLIFHKGISDYFYRKKTE